MQTTVKLLIGSIFLFISFTPIIGGNSYTPFFSPTPIAMLEAVPDTVETSLNNAVSFNVLENDTGEGIFVNAAFQPSHGSLSWKTNGDFTYTPDENYVGPDIIVYQIMDEAGNQTGANVFVTVKGTVESALQVHILQECEAPSIYHVTAQVFGGTPPYIVDFLHGDDFLNLNQSTSLAGEYEFLSWLDLPTDKGYAIIVRDAEDHVVAENHLLEIFCHEDVINTCVLETDFNLTPITTCNDGEKSIEIVPSGGSGTYTFYGEPLTSNGDYLVIEDGEGCQNILFYDEIPAYTCPKAHDDVVNGAYNAPFHLKPLLNDEGEGLYISHIGGLSNGTIQWRPDDFLAYFPNEDFTGIDTIEYEITDIVGNTSQAKILAVVPENDEVEIFWNWNCNESSQDGTHTIRFTVAGGKPPYSIAGVMALENYYGDELVEFTTMDNEIFTIEATDREGEIGVATDEIIPCSFEEFFEDNYTFYITCAEGENFGILTALFQGSEIPENLFEGNLNGDTIPNETSYSIYLNWLNTNIEGIVYCPPIANNDLYYNHPSYLQFPLTFNPLLNDNGHGLRLVEVEQPKYGTLEWWQADGTVSYRPNADFQGVETFDYTLEDIGGNRTQATIKIVMAHPTELQITYERDCSEVIENGAEKYTINAFVSGGVPPYQVQINEGEFFELTENGEMFNFEVLNGEGFTIYAEDAGVVTHEAMVEELEIAACSELVVEVERDCSTYCEGYYYLHVAITSGTPPFIISGTINDTLETIGFVSTTDSLQNDEPYEIYVTDGEDNEFSEVVVNPAPCPIFGSCCETLLIETIDEVATCLCDGSMIFHFQALSDTTSITEINGYWIDDTNGENIEVGDTILNTAYLELYEISTENDCYHLMIGEEDNPVFIQGAISNFCNPETYTLEAQYDATSTPPDESVTINILQNDTGTNLQISAILTAPSCGEILEMNPETGEILYQADYNNTCAFDAFTYEVVDECGNTAEATVTIAIAPDEHAYPEVTRDCSEALETGFYTLNIAVPGNDFPAVISGSIDTILYEAGFISLQIEDGTPYEISIIYSDGTEFYELGGEIACTELPNAILEIESISEIGICLCDGSIELYFEHLLEGENIIEIIGYWENSDSIGVITEGVLIPNDAIIAIEQIKTEENIYQVYMTDNFGSILEYVSNFCNPETYILEAQDDFAPIHLGEVISINVLQNDIGTDLQINQIVAPPSCGEILEINQETGTIVYTFHFSDNCTYTDGFIYEVIDDCGNVAEALATIVVTDPEPTFAVMIERDCSEASETGMYTLNASIFGDYPPFVVSGSIDTTLYEEGTVSTQIEDGTPYQIQIIDGKGDEFYEIGGEIACTELPNAILEIESIGEIGICLCDGSIELYFEHLLEGENIIEIIGYWENSDSIGLITEGVLIPNDAIISIERIKTEENIYQVYMTDNFGSILEYVSDFCNPETYTLEAQDDFTSVVAGEAVTIDILQNDTGTNLFIKQIINVNCGEILQMDSLNGTITYIPDSDTNCQFETIVYEVEDACGNVTSGSLSIEIFSESTELIVEVFRDCINAAETGYYDLNVAISSGVPPYYVEIKIINTTSFDFELSDNDVLSISQIPDGSVYEVIVEDATGSLFEETGGSIPCSTAILCEELEITNLEEIITCDCVGNISLDFKSVLSSEENYTIYGVWKTETDTSSAFNNGIPAGASFTIHGIGINDGCYEIAYQGDDAISGFTSDFCNPETYILEAQDDFATTEPGEAVTINILQNDTGINLEIVGLIVSPSCGTITSLNPETGEIVYVPDVGTSCNSDTFAYEIIDDCDETTFATATIIINQSFSDLIIDVDRDCTNAESTGIYTLNVLIIGGTPPFQVSGSINETLESVGHISVVIEDGIPYEVAVVDGAGEEFYETGGDASCLALCPESTPFYIEDISEIATCTCNGDLIFHFEGLPLEGESGILGQFWQDGLESFVEVGTLIPNDATLDIWGFYTANEGCFDLFLGEESGINGLTSDFCNPETYILEAQDDFTSVVAGEAVTIDILQNDTGTNLSINAITVPPSCGEILGIDQDTGEIIYAADANTICAFDSFVCEVIDECGNTVEATVTIVIIPYEPALFLEIERDCTDAENTGVYTVHVDIIAGIPPFTISGSLNETIESLGEFSILIADGFPYEILIVDAEGDEYYEIDGETSCCEQAIGGITLNESESQTITCGEENIVLNIEGAEANTYNWFLDEAATIPANPPTGQIWVNDEKVGERTVYLVATYGDLCTSDTLSFTTSAYEPIEIIPTYDCVIDSETQDSIAILSYQITGGDGNYTSNGNTQNETLQNETVYTIEVTDGNGCFTSISDTIDCDFLPISDIDHPISNIKIYPNPSNGNFTLSLQLEQAEDIDIEILDILGQEKLWQRLQALPTVEQHDFNLDLPSGLYFLQVSGKNWRRTEKVIVR